MAVFSGRRASVRSPEAVPPRNGQSPPPRCGGVLAGFPAFRKSNPPPSALAPEEGFGLGREGFGDQGKTLCGDPNPEARPGSVLAFFEVHNASCIEEF